MDDLIEEVNRAIRARGWSARHASRQIGGSLEFVRNLRRGYVGSRPVGGGRVIVCCGPGDRVLRAGCSVVGPEQHVLSFGSGVGTRLRTSQGKVRKTSDVLALVSPARRAAPGHEIAPSPGASAGHAVGLGLDAFAVALRASLFARDRDAGPRVRSPTRTNRVARVGSHPPDTGLFAEIIPTHR